MTIRPIRRESLRGTLLLLAVLVGCSPATAPASPPRSPQTFDAPAANEVWRTAQLRDVRTGEAFRISDLAGRLVVIEPMAIWCATCRIQQNEARQALANLEGEELVYISLDVDPNETEEDLARYAEESGFPWRFVVAPREVSRSLAESFGDQVLSPPATPTVVLAPDGSAEVHFGVRRASQLEAQLKPLLP